MKNVESLNANFPGAPTAHRYLTRVRDAIEPLGYDRQTTFTMVSVCRDELAQSLAIDVTKFWQRPFELGGLGGLPPGGIEAWEAGLSHMPYYDGRGKLLVFGAAHTGIGPDGTLGVIHRHLQPEVTAACGGLGPIAKRLHAAAEGTLELQEPAATEAGRLKRAMLNALGPDSPRDVRTITIKCAEVINDVMWEALEFLSVHTRADIVVCTGVQIHQHDDVDHFMPLATTFKGADGKLVPIELG